MGIIVRRAPDGPDGAVYSEADVAAEETKEAPEAWFPAPNEHRGRPQCAEEAAQAPTPSPDGHSPSQVAVTTRLPVRRAHRLRDSQDFRRVRRHGRSLPHPLLVLIASPGGGCRTRVGISVSKRVGGAVVRNRVKRRIREAVRRRLDDVASGWDLVFIVRRPAAGASFWEILAAVDQLLGESGTLAGESCGALPRA